MRGVDMGNPMWGMHSARETSAAEDTLHAIKAFTAFYDAEWEGETVWIPFEKKKKMALSANSAFIKFQGDKLKQFQFSCLYVGARKRGLSFFCICGSLLL